MATTLRYGTLCCLIYASLVLSIKSKQEVYNYLFASGEYNRNLRPEINNGDDPVITDMMPILMRIRGLHENNEVLQSTFFLHMEWTDPRLAWSNTDLDNISQIIVPTTHVWTPDIVLYNSASPARAQQGLNVIVKKDGSVSWVPMYDFDSECDTDLYYFPYDTQSCELQIGSWSYIGTELMMKFPGTESNKSSLYVEHEVSTKENQEWELVNHENNMEIRLIDYECCEPSPTLHINIRLRRRPSYFHYVIIAPAVLFSFLIPVIFIFPYHAGERTALGILVLLGLCYLLHMQVGVQLSVTRIVKFYITSMVLATLAIAFSALVKAIGDQGSANKAIPKWLNLLLASSVGKFFGVESNFHKESKHHYSSGDEMSNLSSVKKDDATEPSGKLILTADADESQDAIKKWRNAARLLDRVLLVVFMVLFIVTSLSLLT